MALTKGCTVQRAWVLQSLWIGKPEAAFTVSISPNLTRYCAQNSPKALLIHKHVVYVIRS